MMCQAVGGDPSPDAQMSCGRSNEFLPFLDDGGGEPSSSSLQRLAQLDVFQNAYEDLKIVDESFSLVENVHKLAETSPA